MATVAIVVALVLAVVLVAREIYWSRAVADLRDRLDTARARMREGEELANVGQLVSGLAQELKSPLQGMLGNTEVMLASAGGASTDDLRELQENATRAAGIVRHLLAFTETTKLSRRWQDVNDIVTHAADGVRGELEKSSARVELNRADRLPLVYVDGRLLEKVVVTLLARPGATGSRVPEPREPSTIVLSTRRGGKSDDRLIIEVDDRMAADVADEAAWSGDLAGCRRIVEAHGGSLEVQHAAGHGFRFQFELPVTASGVDSQPGAARESVSR
ncbi:MAG: sensor histidine kinase [Gemmatimonadales bacterium]